MNPIAAALPVMEIAGRVSSALPDSPVILVTAPPGAGKSTVLPLTILSSLAGGKVLMLEPRRLAARQVAQRMAFLLGEEVGETVGYRIRFETKVSSRTRVEVITEGILTRMLLEDPTLDGVSVLIFDEFHERSLASDEALAFAGESQRLIRPDLRIVIMSATIDARTTGLDAPLIESHGKSYPVDIRYSESDTEPRGCAEDVARAVLRAHRQTEGDILAFLPGESEIRRCAELLDGQLGGTGVHPLYGMLPFEQQNKAIAPCAEGERKVVLATSIAETSLTIEGVRTVIDSGLYRTQIYNPQNGQSHLETLHVSRDMAAQRAGRAGRVAPGVCIRLYRESTWRSMKESRVPEILEADLLPLALDMAVWGAKDAADLPWITPPPAWKFSQARSALQSLGALDADGAITKTGIRMAEYPCHPRLSRMLDGAAADKVQGGIAADLAAIIEDRDPLSSSEAGVDIDLRVSALREARMKGNRRWTRTIRAAEQYRRMIGVPEDNSEADWFVEGKLLASAFPERIGRLDPEGCGHYTLASGDKVFIDREDSMSANDWIVAVSANVAGGTDGRVFLAARVDRGDLMEMASVTDRIAWSQKNGCVTAAREWRTGNLLIGSKALPEVPSGRMETVICEAVRKQGASILNFSDDVGNLQRRVAAVSSWHPELGLPDLSTASVLENAQEWLPPYIGKATTVAEMKKIDVEQALWGLLTYEQQQTVERLAPSHIAVPTGSRIRVEYRQGADAPVLRVRLQECFGLLDTPRVDDGKRPVLMELLSPGFKPVQLTQDLASFWTGTYFEVRKELRRRYPKHSWPDNPLEAPAVRGVRRK